MGIIEADMSQRREPMRTGNETSGATARSLSVPQARTPMRVLEDLMGYTEDYGLEIQRLGWGDHPFQLVCRGHMSGITPDFLFEVMGNGWRILSIRVNPEKPLEVEMCVDIAPDYTPPATTPQLGGGVHTE